MSAENSSVANVLKKAVVTNFTGDTLTLGFKGEGVAGVVKSNLQQLEQAAEKITGRAIKFSVVVDKNLPPPVLNGMSEPSRSYLVGAMQIFKASDAAKIND